MEKDVARVIITAEQLQRRVREMAREIMACYPDPDGKLAIVTILNGAIIFVADLIRHMPMKLRIELVTVSSYPGKATESVEARITRAMTADLRGQDVLVVDDILDTGKTIRLVQAELARQHPRSIRTAMLLRKPNRAPADLHVDFVGFDVADEFVVGYGLDYDNLYRNLPYLAVLSPSAM